VFKKISNMTKFYCPNKTIYYFFKINTKISTSFRRSMLISFWIDAPGTDHNITSDKLSDQNNEKFYHVKQTVENRRPSKMGDVVTLPFVHFNFIIQFRNMFLFLKSSTLHIMSNLCCVYWVLLCFVWKKWRSLLFITWICRSAVRN
jgi:hypothetical protein